MSDFGFSEGSCSLEICDDVSVPVIVRNNLPPELPPSPASDYDSGVNGQELGWIVWGSITVSKSDECLDDVIVFELLHLRRSPGCWTRPMPGLGDPPFFLDAVISHLCSVSVGHAPAVEMRIVESVPEGIDSKSHVAVDEQLYVWATIFATLDLATGVVEIFALLIDGTEELFENLLECSDRYIILGTLVIVPSTDPVASAKARVFREVVEVIDGSSYSHSSAPISDTTQEMNKPHSSNLGCGGPSFRFPLVQGGQRPPGAALGVAGVQTPRFSDQSSLEYSRSTLGGREATASGFHDYPTLQSVRLS